MCLIIDRPAGVSIPQTWIERAADNNPHGWGIMSAADGKIRVKRGMSMSKFAGALKSFGGAPLSIHWRLATHGTINTSNTHPFEFRASDTDYALMHNGIISGIPMEDKSRSDTWHFTHNVLKPILSDHPESFGTDALHAVLVKFIGTGNKLVILRADGKRWIVNREEGAESAGLWLSNLYSVAPPVVRSRVARKVLATSGADGKAGQFSEWPDENDLEYDDDGGWVEKGETDRFALADLDTHYMRDLMDFEGYTAREILAIVRNDPEGTADLIQDWFGIQR